MGDSEETKDDDLKIKENEEILIQYVQQIDQTHFLMFPLRESVFVGRGLILEVDIKNSRVKSIEKIQEPPEELCRPGVCY